MTELIKDRLIKIKKRISSKSSQKPHQFLPNIIVKCAVSNNPFKILGPVEFVCYAQLERPGSIDLMCQSGFKVNLFVQ